MLSILFSGYRFIRRLLEVPLAALGVPYHNCRFTPSCSEYCEQAIGKYGPIKGGGKCLNRIGRCRPGVPGGYDPIQ